MFEKRIIPRTILWIGNTKSVFDAITYYIQSIYCKNVCNTCRICVQIKERDFYALYYVSVKGEIKIEQIETMISIAQYERGEQEPFFFILPHVEYLSLACANRILKLLDSALIGYYFIFTTQNEKTVIPTIASRCFIYREKENYSADANIFCTHQTPSFSEFLQCLDSVKEMNEHDFFSFLDTIFYFWIRVYNTSDDKIIKANALPRIMCIKKLLSLEITQSSFSIIIRSLYLEWISLHASIT